MNPVLMARMQMEKDRLRQGNAKKKGAGGVAKSGGLARLGLKVAGVESKKPEKKSIKSQLDDLVTSAGATDSAYISSKLGATSPGVSGKVPPKTSDFREAL